MTLEQILEALRTNPHGMTLEQLRNALRDLFREGRSLADASEAGTLTQEQLALWGRVRDGIATARSRTEELETRAAEAAEFRSGAEQFERPAGSTARGAAATQAQREELARRDGRGRRTPGRGAARGGGPGLTIIRPGEGRESRSEAGEADEAELFGIAETFLRSAEYESLRARGHSGETDPVEVRSFFHQFTRGLSYEGEDADGERELRALVRVGALPADWVAPFRVPGVFTPDLPEFNVRSAFLNGQTNSNVIQYYRELAFTNAADWVAEATATAGVSGLKPESGLTWERATAPVETLAHWVPVTNQTLEDDPQMQGIIEGRLIDGLREVEDDALINGTGTAPEIDGLLNVTGVQVLDQAYFTANPVRNVATDIEDFDRILRGRRMTRTVGRARPSFVFLSPEDMERLLSTTTLDDQYMIAGGPFGSSDRIATIWRLPVIETEALIAGTAIVGDGRMAAVWDRMAASIRVGLINDQLVRNMQTILAEERLAFAVYRPPAFAIVDLAG